MRVPLKTCFLLFLLLLVTGAVFFNVLLARIAGSEEFRRFAEERASEYLKAKVHIGEIKPYRFNQIALDQIIIETPDTGKGSQLIRVGRLLFRYHLNQLWNRTFNAPAAVVLRNPTILIEQDQFPYRYFESGDAGASGFSMPSLDFKSGEIRYLLPSIGKEILLSEVEGKILPSLERQVEVDVRAKATGFLEGNVHIHGTIRPFESTHDLWLELESMNFSQEIPLPFKELKGKAHWVGRDLFFEDLHATLHGWQTTLSGALVNREGQPEVTCHLRLGKEVPWFKLDLLLNLFQQKLEGTFQAADDRAVAFTGKVHQDGKRFVMDSLSVGPDCQGRGELDFATGNYGLAFEKGSKRMEVRSNLKGMDFAVHFRFDHFRILGLDLVTQGKFFLHAGSARWQDRNFSFKGAFETDYFVLEQQPFDDFKGIFEASPYGITGIQASWGNKFQMTGQVLFPDKKPQGKLVMRVGDFDLGLVKEFASKPLPKELGGILDGKLSVEGDLSKPEVLGIFNIRDGKWGKVDYDRGIIQFRGTPPLLPLRDSKIWRGRTTFFLNGTLDLRLDNIFAGVKIETPDKLVIWKGLEAVLHPKEGSLEVGHSLLGGWKEFSPLEASANKNVSAKDLGRDDEDEAAVKFGPKLKF